MVVRGLLAAVELTSLLRRRLPPRLWRGVHALSFPLYAVATVHVLLAGTDADDAWALVPVVAAAMAVAFLSVARAVDPVSSSGP